MNGTANIPGRVVAAVQVWGKGYRVTADSEEFQRYVPRELRDSSSLEATLGKMPWGRVLESLYTVVPREMASQRCVLFSPSELMALSFARTEDRHRRPSMVLTSACATISWDRQDLGTIAARCVELAARLANAYADAFTGNPDVIGQQLRDDAFLPSRIFDLSEEVPDTGVEWEQVLLAVRQWRGISGVATARLLPLGANVVLGTKHEAERAQKHVAIDGVFDVRDKAIQPLSPRLTPWTEPRVPAAPSSDSSVPAVAPDLRPVAESLGRIERTLDRLVDLAERVIELAFRENKRRR